MWEEQWHAMVLKAELKSTPMPPQQPSRAMASRQAGVVHPPAAPALLAQAWGPMLETGRRVGEMACWRMPPGPGELGVPEDGRS
jgi:hypothetical protein